MNKDAFIAGFLKKQAGSQDDAFKMRMILTASLLAGQVGSAYGSLRLRKALINTPKMDRSKIPDIYNSVGINNKMPTRAVRGLQNAMYFHPQDLVGRTAGMGEDFTDYVKANNDLIKKLGLIAYAPNFARAGVLAHEAGHAAIETTKPRFSPSRLNQRYLTRIGGFMNSLAPIMSVLGGRVSRNPLVGAGIGGLLGALTGGPELINEYQATNYAKKYLNSDDHNMRDTTVSKNKNSLNKAYHTYALANILPSVISGGLAGLIYNNDR